MGVTQTLDVHSLWSEVSKSVQHCISENNFNAWISGIYPLKLEEEGKTLVLGVPNELTRRLIQKNYQGIIITELMKLQQNIRGIRLTISRRSVKRTQKQKDGVKSIPFDLDTFDRETGLNNDFIFDEFIIAPYNRFAYTAAQVVIEKFGTLYNPFYVYGPTGVGKTHLLQAIGNKVRQLNSGINVCYIPSETFMENYINAIKKDRVKEFRNSYQSYQMFILDDVHFLQKSESTLIEIFHLFNNLINKNAQIVLSSDQPPSELSKMEDRIRTRLNSGVVIDIEQPKYEDMKIVCESKAEKMGLSIEREALDFIVENISRNIREMSGALKSIHLHTQNSGSRSVDILTVKKFIRNHIRAKANVTYESIIETISNFYKLNPKLLSTKSRKREVVYARQMMMYILRDQLCLSYSFIGKQFGDRDHTTVMHSCEKINNSLQNNIVVQRDYENILKVLNF